MRPFPEASSTLMQVSTDGGREPVWAHSGLELFYRNGDSELVAVQLGAGPSFAWDRQDVLFSTAEYQIGDGHPQYDISPDDQRFVMLRISEQARTDSELEELRQRMGDQ